MPPLVSGTCVDERSGGRRSERLLFTRSQISAPLLANRPALRRDLTIHLMGVHPKLFDLHPVAYLMALIDDTVGLALDHGLRDAQAMRVFLQLRWDIAAGFFLEPRISAGVRQHANLGMGCWELLSQSNWGEAWLAAHDYDQPHHWRARLWGEELR